MSVALAQFIMAVQTVVSRNVSPLETAVISVGSIHGGSNLSPNVMPSEMEITGTMRWDTTPPINAPEQTDQCVAAASALVGAGSVNPNAAASTGGEDFAFMVEQRPGAMIMIGNGVNPDGSTPQVHTPHYNFNDAIIPHGVAFWAQIVQQELAQ